MKIFAIADTHLAFATPGKEMDVFGEQWREHGHKIAAHWRKTVGDNDLVLVGGDISWAMRWSEAQVDLEFLDRLPGRKALIRGNHDYWWSTLKKVRDHLPPSLTAIDGDAVVIDGVGVCGTRLWQIPNLSFAEILSVDKPPLPASISAEAAQSAEEERNLVIWRREIRRLGRALADLKRFEQERRLRLKVTMVHYPPCDWRLTPNEATELFENAGVDHVVFGHLHGVRAPEQTQLFGERAGIHYHLTASDYLDFTPLFIAEPTADTSHPEN